MDYIRWRNDIFGQPANSNPVYVELLEETFSLPQDEALEHIDRALIDNDIHKQFSKEQTGIGLQLIYSNSCSDLPFCYLQAGDSVRRVQAIQNMTHLYTNFFERYCQGSVNRVGHDPTDGEMGQLCYMLWDIFVVYARNASSGMADAALAVMAHALCSHNDNCIVSGLHGLGHWVQDQPEAANIIQKWRRKPTTRNSAVLDYARQAMTAYIQ